MSDVTHREIRIPAWVGVLGIIVMTVILSTVLFVGVSMLP